MISHKHLVISLVVILVSSVCQAQLRDAGLWTGFSANGQWSKKVEFNLGAEVRLRENLTEMSRVFYESGAEYKLRKWLDISATYRGGTANNNPYFDYRQRLQFGLAAKKKFNNFAITFQSRWQVGINGPASENDADFYTTHRNKIQMKYTGLKGLDLSSSFELFNNASNYQGYVLQNWRWSASAEKKINKRNYISVGYLIQKSLLDSPQEIDYVVLVNYKYDINLRKKKDKKESDTEPTLPTPR